MEELKEKQLITSKALESLNNDLNLIHSDNPIVKQYYKQFRSSAIQSFEFSIDTLWKFVKLYLIKKFNISIEAANARLVFRECWTVNLIDENEFNLISQLIADRNLSSHSYNEQTAEDISKRLLNHYQLMKKIFDKLI